MTSVAYRHTTHRTKVGDYAERLVFNFLRTRGPTRWARCPFDDQKDIVFNDKTIEVKARSIIRKGPCPNSFAIEENQWRKMDSVDANIFVTIPMSQFEEIKMYWVMDKNAYTVSSFEKTPHKILRFYHISEMENIYTIRNSKINREMYDLNFSKYKV